MKEIAGLVSGDTLTSVVTLLIPGALVGGPLAALLFRFVPEMSELDQWNSNVSLALVALLVIFSGLLMETLRAELEVRWDGVAEGTEHGKGTCDEWHTFLRLAYVDCEPVIHRAIRRLVASLKFEMSTAIGLAFFVPLFCVARGSPLTIASVVIGGLCLLVATWLLYQGFRTHSLLASYRRRLLREGLLIVAPGPEDEWQVRHVQFDLDKHCSSPIAAVGLREFLAPGAGDKP